MDIQENTIKKLENNLDDMFNYAYEKIINAFYNKDYYELEDYASEMLDYTKDIMCDLEMLQDTLKQLQRELKTTIEYRTEY